MAKYPNNSKYLVRLLILSALIYGQSSFGAELNFDGVAPALFNDFINLIDRNIAMCATLAATAGGIIAQGDLRTRAIGAGTGLTTSLIMWRLAKTLTIGA